MILSACGSTVKEGSRAYRAIQGKTLRPPLPSNRKLSKCPLVPSNGHNSYKASMKIFRIFFGRKIDNGKKACPLIKRVNVECE